MSIVHTSYFHISDRREDKKKKKEAVDHLGHTERIDYPKINTRTQV